MLIRYTYGTIINIESIQSPSHVTIWCIVGPSTSGEKKLSKVDSCCQRVMTRARTVANRCLPFKLCTIYLSGTVVEGYSG